MTLIIQPHSKYKVSSPFRLQWEEAQDCHVLLYPEGMVRLNKAAGKVLEICCLQNKSLGEAIDDLAQAFDEASSIIREDVHEFIQVAYENQWIEGRT